MQHLASTADKLAAQSQAATEYVSEEAIEELVAGAVDPMLENLYDPKAFGTRYKDPDTYADIAYSMLIGGLMGGIGTGGKMLVNNVTNARANRANAANITSPVVETEVAASGRATTALPRITMEDFQNRESPIWNNVDYTDTQTRNNIQQRVHQEMVDAGKVVEIPESTRQEVAQSYPDLRTVKKQERVVMLKQKMNELKANLRQFLNSLKGGSYEFEVNGNILEAKLYDTGVEEVMKQITQDKASMLYTTQEIFKNARYLYSTPNDAHSKPGQSANDNIYRWNYFYTPIKIGDQTLGVRIAIRDMAKTQESQIYNWGIKKDTTLDDGGDGNTVSRTGVSSVVSIGASLDGGGPGLGPNATGASSDVPNNNIPQTAQNSKPKNLENRGIVDGTMVPGYNRIIEMEGAVTNGRAQTGTQLDRASGEGVPEGPGVLGSGGVLADTGTDGRAHLQGSGELRLNKTQDKKLYSRMLTEAREQDTENGWAVTPKTAEMLADCKTYLSDDGGVGYAIAPDEDIVAVFRNKQRHHQKGVLKEILPEAIANGGRKLDCYGKDLALLYAKFGGFTPVARAAFNPEYANPGWTPDNGTPDIYVMMATDTDPDTVRQKQGSYKLWSDAELDALPLMEYDEAMAYRDRLLAEQHSYGREMARLKEAYKQVLAAYDAAADIDPEQAGARSEIKLARAILQSQYEAALTQARASGDFSLANALYKELVRIQKLKREDDR